jgi:hypothetical protein
MAPVSSLKLNPGAGLSALTAQIDLGSISPVARQTRTSSPDDAVRQLATDTMSKANGLAPKRSKPSPSTQQSGPRSNERTPTAYVVVNTRPPTRMNVDDMPIKEQVRLNTAPGWTPVQGGKFGVRFSAAESKKAGVPVYEIGGGKSVVKIKAESWAQAAKEAVRLSANGALAPRNVASSNYEPPTNPKNYGNQAVR